MITHTPPTCLTHELVFERLQGHPDPAVLDAFETRTLKCADCIDSQTPNKYVVWCETCDQDFLADGTPYWDPFNKAEYDIGR